MQTTRRNFFKISGILAGLAALNPVKLCQAVGKKKSKVVLTVLKDNEGNHKYISTLDGEKIRVTSKGIYFYSNNELIQYYGK